MRYAVASDIHGSYYYAEKVRQIFEREQADRLILLGDLYYHGPRNPLPKDYQPMEVSKLLNRMREQLLCIKGNCDAEVDEMISEFPFEDHICLEIGGKKVYFTHGHHQNKDHIPADIDVLVYGHFHTGFIEEKDGVLCVNAGSVSLPKNGTPNSYLLINEEWICLKDLEGNVIDKASL